MKKIILLLLSVLLLLSLAGCAAPVPASTAPKTEPGPVPVDFLRYIRDVLIPQEGLADISVHTFYLGSDGSLPEAMGQEKLGLLSACVRDFDADGTQELLTFSLAAGDAMDTYLGGSYYERPLPCLVLEMKLYTAGETGTVTLSDAVPAVSHLESHSWGSMLVQLDNLDGQIYITARAAMDDMNTQGPSPCAIFHIQQGKFVFDYAGKASYGQWTMEEDPNELLGTRNFYLPKPDSSTHFEGGREPVNMLPDLDTLDAWLEAGTPWLVCGFLLETDGGGTQDMDMTCKAGDASGLREALETGTLTTAEIPAGQLVEDPVPEDAALEYASALIGQVETLCGISMEVESTNAQDEYDIINLVAPEGTTCRIQLSSQTHTLFSLRLTSTTWTADPEWTALKDAILTCGVLELPEEGTSPMLGDINMNTFSSGTVLGDKRIVIAAVNSCFLIIDSAN